MKNLSKRQIVILFSLSLLTAIPGCGIKAGSHLDAKYQRTDEQQSPLEPGSTIFVETSFGSINIKGSDSNQCSVTADITVKAPTEAEAKQIAARVSIKLDKAGNKLVISVNKPRINNNRSIAVSFDISIPRKTNIKCNTSYGSIKLSDITGSINAQTSFAAIAGSNLDGTILLKTSYGGITCNNITSSKFTAYSNFGSIGVDFSTLSPADLNANLNTSYGSVSVVTPPNFAGQLELDTNLGSIKIDRPITVTGELSKEKIIAQLGQGAGKIVVKTSFGAINLR